MHYTPREMYDPYEELANAIVMQACIDYIKTQKKIDNYLQRDISSLSEEERIKFKFRVYNLKRQLEVIEEFFFSSEYAILTNVDPKIVLKAVKEELEKETVVA